MCSEREFSLVNELLVDSLGMGQGKGGGGGEGCLEMLVRTPGNPHHNAPLPPHLTRKLPCK